MKSALLLLLFTFISIDVFGADVEVMVGDSVTLHTDTIIQTEDVIEWSFGQESIAMIDEGSIGITASDEKLKDRLQLDRQTGDLMIRHIKTTDFGDYKFEITRTIGSSKKTFSVRVVSADAAQSVTVNEGDSVTLLPGLTDIQRENVKEWRFEHHNSPVPGKTGKIFTSNDPDGGFRGSMKLNKQTGSLNIININTTDSGLYEVDISRRKHTIHKTFNVTVSADRKSVSLMEGDSVTLHTGFTETQTDDKILWKFGDHDKLIASLNITVNKTWRNIDLNSQTGDLNIRNIPRDQHGDYKVEIITRRMILHCKYGIAVGEIKPRLVKKGENVALRSATEIQKNDEILWTFGEAVLAEIFEATQQFKTYDGPDGRFRDRLKLDHQTGSLTITDTTTTDSGLYKMKISSSRYTIKKRFIVDVSGSDHKLDSGPAILWIVIVVILAAAVVGLAAVVICYHRKFSELKTRRRNCTCN